MEIVPNNVRLARFCIACPYRVSHNEVQSVSKSRGGVFYIVGVGSPGKGLLELDDTRFRGRHRERDREEVVRVSLELVDRSARQTLYKS